MEYVARTDSNPFGQNPPCERFVPGYGDVSADFHVIGDHPGIHGGERSKVPFTDRPWSAVFFETLVRAGLFQEADLDSRSFVSYRTFLSYLHMCVPEGDSPDADSYVRMEPFFDSELRAITAHVLVPVGERATAHVLKTYTSTTLVESPEMDTYHATEIRGAGWLVIPVKHPADWTDDDAEAFVDRITSLEASDYRQVSDLGRFMPGDDAYFVR